MKREWTVVFGLFVVLMSGSGFAFYNHSVYMAALVHERGLQLTEASQAVSLFFVASGISGMVVARLMTRFDVRWIMLAGALVAAAAMASLPLVRTVRDTFALFLLFGLGYSASSMVPATTLVTRWFDERRSLALAIASTGLSVGGVVLMPLSVTWIDAYGLAGAMPRLALLHLALVVPMILFLVREPERGITLVPGQAAHHDLGVAYQRAVASRYFVLQTLAFVLIMLSQVGGIAHLFTLGQERFGSDVGKTAGAILAACSITGRLLGGMLVSRTRMRGFAIVNGVGQALGLYLLASSGTVLALWSGAALFGLTVGNLLMLQPLLLAEAFGMRDYGRIYALAQACTTLGVAAGPALLGAFHEGFGGYWAAFALAAAGSLFAVSLLVASGPLPPLAPPAGEHAPRAAA